MMRRKRPALRRAFVMTIGAVAVSGACNNQVDFAQEGSSECPGAMPAPGTDCDQPGLGCSYTDGCGQDVLATCVAEGWQVSAGTSCNPPPPTCPDTAPESGSACSVEGAWCEYLDLDDCSPVMVGCEQGIWWHSPSSCNPPAPTCPAELPIDGEPCEAQPGTWGEYPYGCSYEVETECGVVHAQADCVPDEDETVVWSVMVPECDPP